MRRVALGHVCGMMFVLALVGCEPWSDWLPWWISDGGGSEPPGEPADVVTIERGRKFAPLGRGYALSASAQGLRIIDARDPAAPRVVGEYGVAANTLDLYRMDDHVILVADFVLGYSGARDDLPLRRRSGSGLLLNIDISERAHPRLVNEVALDDLPRMHLLRNAPEGDALFVLPMIWNGERYRSRVERYELRDGQLVKTGQVTLDATAQAIEGTPTQLLAATQALDDSEFNVHVVDVTGAELSQVFGAKLQGQVGPATKLTVYGEQLRVFFGEPAGTRAIATFDLKSPAGAQPIGLCALGDEPPYTANSMFSSQNGNFYLGSWHLDSFSFDATGNCAAPTTYASDNTESYALHELPSNRFLALHRSSLSLYDGNAIQNDTRLAEASLTSDYAYPQAAERIQLARLSPPATADNGTPEPVLVSLPSSAATRGSFHLLTLSDQTLSSHNEIELRGYAEATAVFGRTLLAASSTQLSTFDLSDLDQPVEVGQLELAERYPRVFGFGDYLARIRQHPWVLPPEDRAALLRDDLQVLQRSGGPPLASLAIAASGDWVQVGSVLANVRLSVAEYGTMPKARVEITAYDLSDPTQPRAGGSLSTTEIEAEWSGGHFTEPSIEYHALGAALIIPQWKRMADAQVSNCWRTVDYDACANETTPDCEPEVYTGQILCRRVDAEPEQCTVLSLTHCDTDHCEMLDTLPDGIPSIEDGCNNRVEPGRATTFEFNVIDLREPANPRLVRPVLALPDDDFLRQSYVVSSTKIYTTERSRSDELYATEIDFSDPVAPTLSARRKIPSDIVAAQGDDVYTSPRGWDLPELSLSRMPCCTADAQPAATRVWPERALVGLSPNNSGQLLLLHGPRSSATPSPDTRASWTRLEVLDAQTLATIGALDLDEYTLGRMVQSDGRVLIEGAGALFLVDLQSPSAPRLQAAVLHGDGPSLLERGQLLISDELGFRSYPANLNNLTP